MIPSRPLFLGDIIGNTFVIATKTWTRAAVAAIIFMAVPAALILFTANSLITTTYDALEREGYLEPKKLERFRERIVRQLNEDNPAFLEIYGIAPDAAESEAGYSDSEFSFDMNEFMDKYAASFSPYIALIALTYALMILASLGYQVVAVDLASRQFEERKLDLKQAVNDTLRRNLWLNIIQFLILIFILAFGLGVVVQFSGFLQETVAALLILAAVIMTIISALRLLFAQPALVAESLGPIAALKRSWEITRGNGWRIFGVFIVFGLVVVAVYVVLSIPFAALTSSSTNVIFNFLRGADVNAGHIFTSLRGLARELAFGMLFTTALFASLSPSFMTVFYYDLRTRKDGPLAYEEEAPAVT